MWGDEGKVLAIHIDTMGAGRTMLLPVARSGGMPPLPIQAPELDASSRLGTIKGAKIIDKFIIPGPASAAQYVWINQSVHRNLYRIPVR
jgi:hypothetical protein